MTARKTRSFSGNTIYLVAILVVATIAAGTSTLLTYRNARRAAEDSLRLQALGVAVSLEASIVSSGVKDVTFFRDIITEGRWEGIAYIGLYDTFGRTVLHSNEGLIGRRVDDAKLAAVTASQRPDYGFATLGTGEQVFVATFPIHRDNLISVLRVALHTYPVEQIIGHARLQAMSIGGVVLMLWVLGLFVIRAMHRNEDLHRSMAERERLAVLGEMASVLAHEIRNPLGSIKGFAQYLIERNRHEAGKHAGSDTDYLLIIVNESRRLESLTEDLLVYARPVEVRVEQFGLSELVEETVKPLVSRAPADGTEFRVAIASDLLVTTDRDKLKQIITNLIQNALDALQGRGVIEITAERGDADVRLQVRDNGAGMDEKTVQKAFSPFFTTKTRGTGLGLAIVAKLAASLGAAINLQSILDNGTTAIVTIPAKGAKRYN